MNTIHQITMDQVLQQMREMASKAQGLELQNNTVTENNFSNLLQNSINQVNQLQKNASELATRFESGDPNIELTDVMLNLQKANVSFQAMTQVRNKLVTAYQEIMNMQV